MTTDKLCFSLSSWWKESNRGRVSSGSIARSQAGGGLLSTSKQCKDCSRGAHQLCLGLGRKTFPEIMPLNSGIPESSDSLPLTSLYTAVPFSSYRPTKTWKKSIKKPHHSITRFLKCERFSMYTLSVASSDPHRWTRK